LKNVAGWVMNIIFASCIGLIFGLMGLGIFGFVIGFATYFVTLAVFALLVVKIFEWLDKG